MGKIFVCSDIHGQYEKYERLWQYVSDDDTLYIIGDVIDRGPDGMKILTDIMVRRNVIFIMGNHECMMYHALFKGDPLVDAGDRQRWLEIWTQKNNGGAATHADYMANYQDRADEIARFLEACPVSVEVNEGGRRFIITHAMPDLDRIGELASETVLSGNGEDSIVWDSPFKILRGAAKAAIEGGRTVDAEDRMEYPLMDLQNVPWFYKPMISGLDPDAVYIVGHVIVQSLWSPKMIHVPIHDKKLDTDITAEFLDIDGGLAAYKNKGQGGLMDTLSLILYSITDDKAVYL